MNFRLSLVSADKRQPEIRLRSQAAHRGLHQHKQLMFSVTSAPAIYQQIVRNVLNGCPEAANNAGDLII